jgi:catechol 2,3-dioxygenase-like lactoylglutathione lyase family enzyme
VTGLHVDAAIEFYCQRLGFQRDRGRVGEKPVLIGDPSGNPIELFEPILPEAKLTRP